MEAQIRGRAAATAGLLAGAAAIGLNELLAGVLGGAPSLISGIGQAIIALQPAGAKQLVVDIFGDADKLALLVAVALAALAVSAGLGVLARRRRALSSAGFALFGVLGLAASIAQPMVDPILAVIVVALSVAVAIWVRNRLFDAATRPPGAAPRAEMPDWARRRFLGTSLAVAGAAVVGGTVGRVLLARQESRAALVPPLPSPATSAAPLAGSASLAVDGLTPIVVPTRDFYRIDTQLLTPRLDASTWQLTVNGMVDRQLTFRYADLVAMPQVEEYVTLACVSNEVGGNLVGNARWSGVPLRHVLDMAGVQEGATQLVGRSFDNWTAGVPTSWLDDPKRVALIALGMNGEPLPAEHGYPARLVIPGLYGYVANTKWLVNIDLTTLQSFDAYWVRLGWAKEGPILTQSRIDTPAGGRTVQAGTVPVAGVAWAPERGIRRVEVQVDDGPWSEAELSTPISVATWVQFVYRWAAQPGRHQLRVRATDGTGALQPQGPTPPEPDGARGYHTVEVNVQ
ncbi:MAG TPA: molybdopterin-dependent oxidoreductase [Candidatus Limnocylindria bacterium]|nr:molybdopterin-dependent oxidoreductase [Candidatus Limnocylindria bacterium]